MSRRSPKPSAPKKPSVADTPLTLAQGPDLAKQIAEARDRAFDHTSPERCFAHFRPLAEAIPPGEVTVFRGTPLVMLANVKQALTAVEPALPKAASMLRDPRIEDALELPAVILGLQHAAARVPGAALSSGQISSLLAEQSPWRLLMLDQLDVLASPQIGLVPAARVAAIRAGSGPLDRAEDFVAVAGLYSEYESAIAGRHPFTAAQLDRIAEVGATLLQHMRPGNAPKAPTERGPEAQLCDRFGALATQRYAHLLMLASVGFGTATADAVMPSLHGVTRAAKADRADAKKPEEKKPDAPVAAPPRPSAAPPARPSAPPSN